jgi:hypothetical protein
MLTNYNLPEGGMMFGAFQMPQNISISPLGAVLFVQSGTGLDSRSRLKFFGVTQFSATTSVIGPQGDPSKPLASVFGTAGALSYCAANRGDIVIVLPGHAENLSANSSYAVVAGVTIIGVGAKGVRPVFTFTGGANTTITTAAGTLLQNMDFLLAGVASVAAGFTLGGATQLIDLYIQQSNATNHATNAIVVGSSDIKLRTVWVDGTGTSAGCGAAVATSVAVLRVELMSCKFLGNFSVACVSAPTGFTIGSFLMDSCILNNTNSTSKLVTSFVAAVTGIIQYCTFTVAAAAGSVAGIFSGSNAQLWWLQNYGMDTAATALGSGILAPAATTFT